MKRFLGLIAVLALSVPAGARAQQLPAMDAPHEDWLARHLFPPELVMQQQRAIGLKPEQRTAITRAIQEFQGRMVDFQWQMQEETQRLAELIEKPAVDQAAALAQVDKVLAVEREVKRAHLGLLIQIKNTLTPEQQAKLAAARS